MSRAISRLAVIVLTLSAVSVAVGTGASLAPGSTDPVGEDVSLSPSSGANGAYASVVDGDLVVDLTPRNPNLHGNGVGDGTLTTVDDVFVVHYGGERFARIWLTHNSESITVRASGRPIESESNAVVLSADESATVGMRIDATGSTDELLADLTVHARIAEPEDVEVGAADVAPASGPVRSIRTYAPSNDVREFTVTNAPAGAPVTLDADRLVVDAVETGTLTLDELIVTGDGGPMSVDVRVLDGTARPDADVGVRPLGAVEVEDGGSVESAAFRFSAAPAYFDARRTTVDRLVVRRNDGRGWRSLDARHVGTRNGRVVFEAQSPGFSTFVVGVRASALRVTGADLSRSTVTLGESATTTVSVRNDGLVPGERTFVVSLDGERTAARAVELAPGESTTIRFAVAPQSPGRYAVSVGGVDSGTLVVDAPRSTPASITSRSPGTASGAADPPVEGAASGPPALSPSSAPPSPTPADRAGEPVGEPATFSLSSMGWLFALVAVLVVWLVRRQRGGEGE
ncbi:CARDB domain-containing protein [Haloplanus pelagicus]|jgi:hypothetical protein|uniref:CARDB domain-containing protein n=1 Tax=Haloplanus pelagicus TaxID=2949995 RepID=UPI00203C030D|nr:CARDB domain-containing protein [Haloplanus sp. HW8-1]